MGWCSGDHYNEGSNRGGKKSRKMAEHGSFNSEQFERNLDQIRGDNLEKVGVESCLYAMLVRFSGCTPIYYTKCRVIFRCDSGSWGLGLAA